MNKQKDEINIDYTIRDAQGRKLDEGYMSITKGIAVFKKLIKQKFG